MPADNTAAHDHDAEEAAGTRMRPARSLWDGVLPDALGACFVAVVFSGFLVAYFVSAHFWRQRSVSAYDQESRALAQAMAETLGRLTAAQDAAPENLLPQLAGVLPRVRALRWSGPDGEVRFTWPRTIPGAVGTSSAGGGRPAAASGATAAVHAPDGTALGRIEIEREPAPVDTTPLVWNWGIAAGVTLIVFALFYYRLRRHLRPVAAIERSLRTYADGLESELVTLTLSDSLGTAARGWNQLVQQLIELQRQAQTAQSGTVSGDVLARFESAAFRHVVDRLPYGILWVGENQCISYANAAAAALLGRSVEELVGRAVSEAVDNPAVTQALIGAQARAAAGLSVDDTTQEGTTETTLRFRVLRLSDQSGRGDALITVEDISQLRESQRARDNFLYHVTHELRTPLTNIHAYTETLTKPGFDDEQTRKECYNVIISETSRLSHLVEDILGISQLEVGTARLSTGDVDLLRLVRQMVQDNLGAADEKKIDLTLSVPPKMPIITGDKQRLSVLLNNLIGNAVKYTPEGGQVNVKLEALEHGVQITVRDNGIGIAPEDQEHVFDKFYRAADDAVQMKTGTGLGLALAREVARLHGGEIRLESQVGEGSTFTVTLPLLAAEHAEVTPS